MENKTRGLNLIYGFLILFSVVVIPSPLTSFQTFLPSIYFAKFVLMVVFIGASFFLIRKVHVDFFTVLFFLQLVLLLASESSVDLPPEKLWKGIRFEGVAYQLLLGLTTMSLIGILYQFRKNFAEFWQKIATAMVYVGMFQLIFVVTDTLGSNPWYNFATWSNYFSEMIKGTLGNYGAVALVMLFAAIICLYRISVKSEKKDVVFLLLLCFGLGILGNRSTLLPILVVMLLFVVRYRKTVPVVVMSLMMMFFVAPNYLKLANSLKISTQQTRNLGSLQNLHTRVSFWKVSWQIFQGQSKQPFLGEGSFGFKMGQLSYGRPEDVAAMYIKEYALDGKLNSVRMYRSQVDPELGTLIIEMKENSGKIVKHAYSNVAEKAHNHFVDRVLSGGLLYSVIWLILMVWPTLVRIQKRQLGIIDVLMFAAMVYFVLWFPFVSNEIYFNALVVCSWCHLKLPEKLSRSGLPLDVVPDGIASENRT